MRLVCTLLISGLFQLFGSFSTQFLTFWTSAPEGLGNSFSTPFPTWGPRGPRQGEFKVSASTVAALFSKMALTGQRIAMVDMVLLVFTAFPYLP